MTDLIKLTQDEELQQFAVESRGRHARPVAEFLAPTVLVPPGIGFYKEWKASEPFLLLSTRRGMGGPYNRVGLFPGDEQFSAEPHGLEAVVDRIYCESDEDAITRIMIKQALDMINDEAAAGREKIVVDQAVALAADPTAVDWSANVDPVEDIDNHILTLLKQAKCPRAGVLFGAGAFHTFKHHPAVKGRCSGGISYAEHPGLFHGSSEFMPCYSFRNSPSEEGVEFVLNDEILIFARGLAPSLHSRDWMKTFLSDPSMRNVDIRLSHGDRELVVYAGWSEGVERANEVGVIALSV